MGIKDIGIRKSEYVAKTPLLKKQEINFKIEFQIYLDIY